MIPPHKSSSFNLFSQHLLTLLSSSAAPVSGFYDGLGGVIVAETEPASCLPSPACACADRVELSLNLFRSAAAAASPRKNAEEAVDAV
jgi:hypothetical protein